MTIFSDDAQAAADAKASAEAAEREAKAQEVTAQSSRPDSATKKKSDWSMV